MTETKQKTTAWGETETGDNDIRVKGVFDHFIDSSLFHHYISVYLISKLAPDSTMLFCPPSQSIAVDANLDIHYTYTIHISKQFLLSYLYIMNDLYRLKKFRRKKSASGKTKFSTVQLFF